MSADAVRFTNAPSLPASGVRGRRRGNVSDRTADHLAEPGGRGGVALILIELLSGSKDSSRLCLVCEDNRQLQWLPLTATSEPSQASPPGLPARASSPLPTVSSESAVNTPTTTHIHFFVAVVAVGGVVDDSAAGAEAIAAVPMARGCAFRATSPLAR